MRRLAGELLVLRTNGNRIHKYFAWNDFPDIDLLANISSEGIPMDVQASPLDGYGVIAYDNGQRVREHAVVVWSTLKDHRRRDQALVIRLSDVHTVLGSRHSPLGTVVGETVRIVNDFTFTAKSGGSTSSSVYTDTEVNEVRPCLCALAFPKLLEEIVQLRKKYSCKRINLTTSHANEAFRKCACIQIWH